MQEASFYLYKKVKEKTLWFFWSVPPAGPVFRPFGGLTACILKVIEGAFAMVLVYRENVKSV